MELKTDTKRTTGQRQSWCYSHLTPHNFSINYRLNYSSTININIILTVTHKVPYYLEVNKPNFWRYFFIILCVITVKTHCLPAWEDGHGTNNPSLYKEWICYNEPVLNRSLGSHRVQYNVKFLSIQWSIGKNHNREARRHAKINIWTEHKRRKIYLRDERNIPVFITYLPNSATNAKKMYSCGRCIILISQCYDLKMHTRIKFTSKPHIRDSYSTKIFTTQQLCWTQSIVKGILTHIQCFGSWLYSSIPQTSFTHHTSKFVKIIWRHTTNFNLTKRGQKI